MISARPQFPYAGWTNARAALSAAAFSAVALCGALVLSGTAAAQEAPPEPTRPADSARVSYHKDIRPIFQNNCQGCHQPAKAGGGLVMTSFADLFKGGESGTVPIVAGKPAESILFEQILPDKEGVAIMPKDRKPLTAPEIAKIRTWIEEGAEDDTPPSSAPTIDSAHPPIYERLPVISSLDVSPDGKYLAVSGYHEVLIHHADGSGLVARLVGLAERIESVAFSPDSKLLAVTGGSPGRFGEIQLWNVETKELTLSIPLTFDTIFGVSWSGDGTRIAFGCTDNSLRAIDVKTGQQVLYQGAHSDWVLATMWARDSSHIMSVGRDRSMKLTHVATQRFVDNITSITPGALKGGLMTVDRHPNEDQVVIGGADGIPKLYKIYRTQDRKIGDDFNKIREYPGLPGRVFCVRMSQDGKLIAAGSSFQGQGEVQIYQTDDAKVLAKVQKISGGIFTLDFTPDGKHLVTGGFSGEIRIFATETGQLEKEFRPVPLKDEKVATQGS